MTSILHLLFFTVQSSVWFGESSEASLAFFFFFRVFATVMIKEDVTFISLKYYFDRALTKHL